MNITRLGFILLQLCRWYYFVVGEKTIFDGFEIDSEEVKQLLEKERLSKESKEKLTEIDLEYKLHSLERDLDLKHLPTACQVCRLVTDEIYIYLHENGTIIKERKGKQPIFEQSSDTLFEMFDVLCEQMSKYRVRRLRDFRYVKGGQTPEREALNDVISKSNRKMEWVMSHSSNEIDDPTGEIDRLYLKCNSFLQEEEENIVQWFFKSQKYELRSWLCEKRVLNENDIGCLSKSDQLQNGQLEEANAKWKAEKTQMEDEERSLDNDKLRKLEF